MRMMLAVAAFATASIAGAQTLHFGGFGDATVAHTLGRGHTFFETGELDLYGTARFSDRWSLLGEGLIQHVRRDEDVDAPAKHFEIDLERLYVSYDRSDRFRLELGQIHTGIVAWNEREHRNRFLQTPIDPPSIARGEEQGGAWPLHFVGIWASGRLPGASGIAYGAGVGATRGRSRDEVQPVIGETRQPAALLSVRAAPDIAGGLEIGLSAYSGTIPARDGRLRELDTTLSASYVRNAIEIRSEWAQMRHDRAAGDRRFLTRGWYALASYRSRTLRPFVLHDRLDIARGETYLREVRDQDAWAAGVRWDVAARLAIKADVRSQLSAHRRRERVVRAQFAFSF